MRGRVWWFQYSGYAIVLGPESLSLAATSDIDSRKLSSGLLFTA
jgi:hypothetical protein